MSSNDKYFQGDSELEEYATGVFKLKFEELVIDGNADSGKTELFVELLPHLIELMWQEYAQLTKLVFGAEEDHQTEWWFFLDGLNYSVIDGMRSNNYPDETQSYFSNNIGFPSWANISCGGILEVDSLDAIWGEYWLHTKPEAWRLWWALQEDGNGDLLYSSEQRDLLESKLTEDHEDWYLDRDLLGLFEYWVTPNLSLIEKLQKDRGFTYNALSDADKCALIEIAIEALSDEELQESKAAHYLLSLLLNHPGTPDEGKALIYLVSDEHIIKLDGEK